eukprot:g34097.t1
MDRMGQMASFCIETILWFYDSMELGHGGSGTKQRQLWGPEWELWWSATRWSVCPGRTLTVDSIVEVVEDLERHQSGTLATCEAHRFRPVSAPCRIHQSDRKVGRTSSVKLISCE